MFNPLAGLINVLVGLLELLLSLRVFFKFFGVGGSSSFIVWLNNFTQPLVNPFLGILPSFSIGNFLIETPAIIALVVIGLIGYFIMALLSGHPSHHDY